jgi:hypothetical protein
MKTKLIIKVSKKNEIVYDFANDGFFPNGYMTKLQNSEYDLFVKMAEENAKKAFPKAKISWK